MIMNEIIAQLKWFLYNGFQCSEAINVVFWSAGTYSNNIQILIGNQFTLKQYRVLNKNSSHKCSSVCIHWREMKACVCYRKRGRNQIDNTGRERKMLISKATWILQFKLFRLVVMIRTICITKRKSCSKFKNTVKKYISVSVFSSKKKIQ